METNTQQSELEFELVGSRGHDCRGDADFIAKYIQSELLSMGWEQNGDKFYHPERLQILTLKTINPKNK